MGANLDAVRAAVVLAKVVAAEFHTGTAKFYRDGNAVPIFTAPCRVKKPRMAAFDGGNQTEWSTKRTIVIKIPQDANTGIIEKGLIVQVSTIDGDPSINKINFTVESALDSQFSAERNVTCVSQVVSTPRIS